VSLRFILPPFPGEFFYSVAARTCKTLNYTSSRVFARELTGSPRLNVDLGTGFAWTQRDFVEDPSDFVQSTLLSFLSSFLLPPLRRTQLHEAVFKNDKITTGYLLGRMGARRRSLPFYRYCPQCADEQGKTDEPYWTLQPQIRGFTHCPVHGSPFVESPVPRDFPKAFVCLSDVPRVTSGTSDFDGRDDVLTDLSQEGLQLLDFKPGHDSGRLNRAWWRLLRAQNFDPNRRGAAKYVASNVLLRYGERYLETAGCMLGPTFETSWVARLLRAPAKEPDPIRHLLVLRSLGLRLSHLLEESKFSLNHRAIDDRTLLCMNPVCSLFQKPYRKQTRIFIDKKAKREKAQLTCLTCDQTIERDLEDHSIPVRFRIIDRGLAWENELKALWTTPAVSLRFIGVRLGAESLTVKRHAKKLGLSFPRIGKRASNVIPASPKPRPEITEEERNSRRTTWLTAVETEGTTSKARKTSGAAYAWLNRHDKGWLVENCPQALKPNVSQAERVDWAEREKEYLRKLDDAFLKITHRYPTQFCTATAMLIEIRAIKLIGYLDKMPLLQARLQELAEHRVGYAIRRIEMTKKRMPAGYTKSDLIAAVGLKSDLFRFAAIQNSF